MRVPFSRYFRAAFGDASQSSWAFSFQEDEFQEDLRGASGVGKRRRARMRVSSLPSTVDIDSVLIPLAASGCMARSAPLR